MAQEKLIREQNTKRVLQYFHQYLVKIHYKGVFGVANFRSVYHELLPIQQAKLKELCHFHFQRFIQHGSIISIGIAYPDSIIDCINVKHNGTIDKAKWNVYAQEYQKLNHLLNKISHDIATHFGGIPVPATLEGFADEVNHVEEYYGHTISHRVVAEFAGLGWRGKNELIVHEQYSCAIRFVSIITTLPLLQGSKKESLCGNCMACLEACSILKKKAHLENYRENCRKYIIALGLDDEVCGKCIWACYRQSNFKNQFSLKKIA